MWQVFAAPGATTFHLQVGGPARSGECAASALARLVHDLGTKGDEEPPGLHWRECRAVGCARCEALARRYGGFVAAFGPLALWTTDALGEQPAGDLGAGIRGTEGLQHRSDSLDAVLAAVGLLQQQWTLLAQARAEEGRARARSLERLLWGRWPQRVADDVAAQARAAGHPPASVAAIRKAVLRRPYDYLWRHMAFAAQAGDVVLAADGLTGEDPWAEGDDDPDVALGSAERRPDALRSLLASEHPAVRGHPQDAHVRLVGRTWRGAPIPRVAGDGLNYHCARVRQALDAEEDGRVRARYDWPSLFHALEQHLLLCAQGLGPDAHVCDHCQRPYWSPRGMRYCQSACRQAAFRAQRAADGAAGRLPPHPPQTAGRVPGRP